MTGLYTFFYDNPLLGVVILAGIISWVIYDIYKRKKQGMWGKI